MIYAECLLLVVELPDSCGDVGHFSLVGIHRDRHSSWLARFRWRSLIPSHFSDPGGGYVRIVDVVKANGVWDRATWKKSVRTHMGTSRVGIH